MKALYWICAGLGIAIAAYIYLIDFDSLSEEELVNASLLWYLPFIFGFYGLLATRIKNGLAQEAENASAFHYLFSGKAPDLILWVILVAVLSGLIGAAFFLIPLVLFKPDTPTYDLRVALAAALSWIVLLFLFFVVLWPSL